MFCNFLSVYGKYYPPVSIETRVNFRIHMSYHTMLLVVIKCTSRLTDIQLMVSSSHQNCKQGKLVVSVFVWYH